MNGIKEYIEFAIENGYKEKLELRNYSYDNGCYVEQFNNTLVRIEDGLNTYYSITDIITSKEFIEAIVKGKYIGEKLYNPARDFTKEELLCQITTEQAIAIRDGNLEEFITNLLK